MLSKPPQQDDNLAVDAVGPETLTFEELVRLIAASVASSARIMHLNPALALLFSRLTGYLVRDVVLTRDEIKGLMAELLVTPRTGDGTDAVSRLAGARKRHSGGKLLFGAQTALQLMAPKGAAPVFAA